MEDVVAALPGRSRRAIMTKASALDLTRRLPRCTAGDARTIRRMHATHSARAIAARLGPSWSIQRVHEWASRLGLRKVEPWRGDEDAFLVEHYPSRSRYWIAAQLGRSDGGVRARVEELGLRHGRWRSADEDAFLEAHYATLPTAEIAERLGRTPSQLHDRAKHLGLRKRPALSPEAEELLWEMRHAPGAVEFFAAQFRLSAAVLGRVLRQLEHAGGPALSR
jgi:hypothetical protein